MTSAGLPAHEMTYRALKELLLFGEIAPGQAVTIQGLVARLDVGMTPVREALRRLISEGALEFQGNRRVSVPVLTPENLSELKFARAMIERELTLKAFSNIDENGLKQLESLDSGLDSAITRQHKRLHVGRHVGSKDLSHQRDAKLSFSLVKMNVSCQWH